MQERKSVLVQVRSENRYLDSHILSENWYLDSHVLSENRYPDSHALRCGETRKPSAWTACTHVLSAGQRDVRDTAKALDQHMSTTLERKVGACR